MYEEEDLAFLWDVHTRIAEQLEHDQSIADRVEPTASSAFGGLHQTILATLAELDESGSGGSAAE